MLIKLAPFIFLTYFRNRFTGFLIKDETLRVSWYPGILVSRYPSIQVSWYPGILVSWYPGILVSWNPGILQYPVWNWFKTTEMQFSRTKYFYLSIFIHQIYLSPGPRNFVRFGFWVYTQSVSLRLIGMVGRHRM